MVCRYRAADLRCGVPDLGEPFDVKVLASDIFQVEWLRLASARVMRQPQRRRCSTTLARVVFRWDGAAFRRRRGRPFVANESAAGLLNVGYAHHGAETGEHVR